MHHTDLQIDSFFGTLGGVIITVVYMADFSNILSTILLAIIGTVTSFFVTMFLRWVIKKIFHTNDKNKYYPPNE